MAAYQILKSSAAYPLKFLMVLSVDHKTGATGLTPTVTIQKAAGFISPSGAVTELGNGWYQVAGNATDSNTLGGLVLNAQAATADTTDTMYEVVAHNVQDGVHLGLTCLPNTAVTTNGSLITSGAGTAQLSVTSGQVIIQTGTGTGQLDFTSGVVKSNSVQWLGGAIPAVNVTGVPLVDLKYTLGTISAGAAGSVGIDWAQIVNKTTTAVLSGTTVAVATAVTNPVQANNVGVSSSALNAVATAFTQTTGSVTSGTYASTATLDGVSHVTADSAGTLDEYYDFSLGTTGQVGTSFQFEGYVVGAANTIKVYAYNWNATAWDQIGSIVGAATTTDQLLEYDIINSHTSGTGVVRIRFQATGLTSSAVNADRLLVGYTIILSTPTNWPLLSINGSGQVDLCKLNGSSTAAANLSAVYAAFETGTATAGGASTVTLRAGASATNDYFKDQVIFLLSGTGAGQTNRISGYVGSTKIATVETAWVTQPDNTSVYFVLGRIG